MAQVPLTVSQRLVGLTQTSLKLMLAMNGRQNVRLLQSNTEGARYQEMWS